MDTLGIENFISVKATEGPKLVSALEEHVREYDVDIINLQRVKKLFKKSDPYYEVELEGGGTLESKTIILATGARWKELGIPGERELEVREWLTALIVMALYSKESGLLWWVEVIPVWKPL